MISEGSIVISIDPGYAGQLFYVDTVIRDESENMFEACRGNNRVVFLERDVRLATPEEIKSDLIDFLLL